MSALMASAGVSSGPAAFPLLRVILAFSSAFEGLSQLIGSSVSADGMSGGESGVGRFSSSLKCSANGFSCSFVVVSGSRSCSSPAFLSAEILPLASWSPGTGPSDSPARLLSLLF